MKMKVIVVALLALGFLGFSAPALADNKDVSADMTITPSQFVSGEANPTAVAITFPLVTGGLPNSFYIDLPVGYVLTASTNPAAIGAYDPVTGMCGTVDSGITVPALTSGPYFCSTGSSAFPFEFLITGTIPNADYVINLAPGSFTALTTMSDVVDTVKISTAFSGGSLVIDDHGEVAVTTLAKKLPDTGTNTFAMVAFGTLAGLAGITLLVALAVRRRV